MKWVLAEPDADVSAALAGETGLHPLISRLLVIRGVADAAAARDFLSCDYSTVSDPSLFRGMDRAISRINKALSQGERIAVYGDYDVDGITGTALLSLVLKRLGADVHTYIPDRLSEGYGLNSRALTRLKENGAGLVISVDCGISAFEEAAHAEALGLDLIITDHHEPADRGSDGSESGNGRNLPVAHAVLHPHHLADGASDRERQLVSGLTGVGIAFKLAQALLGRDREELRPYLDLVTLGTIADVGRITGENRILVKHGLEALSRDASFQRPGVAALKQTAGLNGKKVGAGTVGFSLAPRINAGGRLERADMALELLMTDDPAKAGELAAALDGVNRERQAVEEAILEEARKTCRTLDMASTGALVLASATWHPGVIGIVASRLVDEFFRPAALISVQNGVGKGSARSIPGFDLYAGLSACSDLLLGYGGHVYAAGFSIAEQNIPVFRERLGALVRERVGAAGFVRTLMIDGAVALGELTRELMAEVERLAPFGQGNPEPRLGARGLRVLSARIVGKNHLKMRLKQDQGIALDAIAFNRGSLLGGTVREGARVAAVFTPRINAWNGSTTVELDIKDIKADT